MLNYYLIFLQAFNFHLIKDIGMIPHYLHNFYRYRTKLLTYKNDNYSYINKYNLGFTVKVIKKSRKLFSFNRILELNLLKYLFLKSKRIDVLNLIHLSKENIRYGFLYKKLNPNGFLYLKMDINEYSKSINLDKTKLVHKKIYRGLFDFLYFQYLKKINIDFIQNLDLISFESKEVTNYFKNKDPQLKNKIIYLPNGINDVFLRNSKIKRIPFSKKENIILTVGRLGSEEKSTKTLLKAVSKIKDLKDWKVILVGPLDKKFKAYISKFFKKYPSLKEVINFTGEIEDRKELYRYYQRSKIFCLTSKYESFGIVLVEAGYFGNYIISSNFASAREITKNGDLGKLFKPEDANELAEIIQELIYEEVPMKSNYKKITRHIEQNYTWTKIIKKLHSAIKKRI